MPQPAQLDSRDRRAARQVIEATLRNAYHEADLVSALLKQRGYKPSKRSPRIEEKAPDLNVMKQAKAMLLSLGATLHLAEWEQAGLKRDLPVSLPSSSEAIKTVVPTKEDPSKAPPLCGAVVRTLLTRFALTGRAELGADVLLDPTELDEEELLEAFVDLLWKHRGLINNRENN